MAEGYRARVTSDISVPLESLDISKDMISYCDSHSGDEKYITREF